MSICVLLSLTVAADVCYQALYPLVLSKILCVLWYWLMFSIFSNAVLLYPYFMLCWLFWQLCSFYLNMSNIVLISHALAYLAECMEGHYFCPNSGNDGSVGFLWRFSTTCGFAQNIC